MGEIGVAPIESEDGGFTDHSATTYRILSLKKHLNIKELKKKGRTYLILPFESENYRVESLSAYIVFSSTCWKIYNIGVNQYIITH